MADILGDMRRTHHCKALGADDIGSEVVLMGWVLRRRDHGGVIFVDLRDREGLTQVVFNPEIHADGHAKAHTIRNEFVIGVRARWSRGPRNDQFQPGYRRHRGFGERVEDIQPIGNAPLHD